MILFDKLTLICSIFIEKSYFFLMKNMMIGLMMAH